MEKLDNINLKLFKNGNVMYFEGNVAKELYLIKSGKIQLTKKFVETDDLKIDSLGEGEFFGLVSAVEGAEHTETATVIEDAEIYVMKPADLFDLFMKNLRIGFKIFSMLSNVLREYDHCIAKLSSNENDLTTSQRLLEIAEYYNSNNKPQQAMYVFQKYLELYSSGAQANEVRQKIATIQGS